MTKEGGKKNTRREFLKYIGGASIYATAGGGLGYAYDHARDYLNSFTRNIGNKLGGLDTKVEELNPKNPVKIAKDVETWRSKLYSGIFGRTKEDKAEFREKTGIENSDTYEPKKQDSQYKEPEITRRRFFGTIFNYANQHPIVAGAGGGTIYGAYKTKKTYKTKKEIAGLKDNVEGLKKENTDLKDRLSGLEEKLKDLGQKAKDNPIVMIGIIGLFISIILSSISLTGFSLLDSKTYSFSLNIIVFLISFLLLSLGIKYK